jgi:transposase
MDDFRCREFFVQPTQPYHRQYEALRAVFLEGHSQKEVADRFGYTYDSLRQLVREFRQQDHLASASAPFFAS